MLTNIEDNLYSIECLRFCPGRWFLKDLFSSTPVQYSLPRWSIIFYKWLIIYCLTISGVSVRNSVAKMESITRFASLILVHCRHDLLYLCSRYNLLLFSSYFLQHPLSGSIWPIFICFKDFSLLYCRHRFCISIAAFSSYLRLMSESWIQLKQL